MHLLLIVSALGWARPAETLRVGGALRDLALPLPEAASEALRTQAWPEALAALRAMEPPGDRHQRADWAFLVAWSAARAGTPELAEDVLEHLQPRGAAPEAYVSAARGEVLLALGRAEAALPAFEQLVQESPLFPTVAVSAAEALTTLGRTDEARKWQLAVVERPDPAPGSSDVLVALGRDPHRTDDERYTALRRAWTFYPDEPAGERAAELLDEAFGAREPTWQARAHRAERWMYAEEYDRAIAETDPHEAHASEQSLDGCRLRFVRGRSHYKRNRLSASIHALEGIGEQCADVAGSYGPRGLYLVGTAEYRRKEYERSAAAYAKLRELYPDHSMVDDAWTRGGISLLEAGQQREAEAWWRKALDEHPDGDTVPEASLRLAFARYDAGDPKGAIAIADRLAELPLGGNAASVEAGRYWSARWKLFPRADAPRERSEASGARSAAVQGWKELCEERPFSFYAILAYSRLVEEAPRVAERLAQRPPSVRKHATEGFPDRPWAVRMALFRNPAFRDGVGLARLGLVSEALREWDRAEPREWTAEEKAWTVELRIAAGDWLVAHDDFRRWIEEHPLTTLGPLEPQIVRLAWPDRYWDLVQAAVKADYPYPARLFHGLVREESTFNRNIVSFAGARGLSQLMWATAKQTAGWLDLPVTRDALFEPETNLEIGARYLAAMHKQLSGSPYLALAAYNGGARNVRRWAEEHGNPPIDEYVERIPYRETRGYVKRVMGTWQTMRYYFDDGPGFSDLSRYNHEALP